MMKWLRVHTKEIMVVTVLLAMFSFVGGSALVQILSPNPDREPMFKAFGHEFLAGDYRLAQRDTEILKLMGIGWQYDQPDRRMSVEDWCALEEEAQKAGVKVSDSEIEQTIKQMEEIHKMIYHEDIDMLEAMRNRPERFTPPAVRHAIRRHMTIMKHAEPISASAAPSESQVKHYVRDTQDKIKVMLVSLDAEKFVDPNQKFTAEELQAQFDKYKEQDKSTSESGMGYKYPRRVKLQYAVANVKKIEPQLNVNFDEVKNYWKANKSKYRKIVYEDAPQPITSQPTSAPTTQPAKIPRSVEKTLGEAKADVERDLRKRDSQRISEQAMAKLAATLQKPWLEQKTSPDTGYKSIPASVTGANYMKETAERIGHEFGVQIEFKETGLLSAEDVEKLDDLKNAAVLAETGATGMKLSELAFRVPAFLKHEKNELGADSSMSLQMNQTPDSPLMTPQRDRIVIFRVVEADEAKSPAKMDDVRDQVEKDLRIAAAMKVLEPRAKEVCAAAQHIGLKDAWALFTDLRDKTGEKEPYSPPPFPRKVRKNDFRQKDLYATGTAQMGAPDVTGVGSSRTFADQCLEMADEGYNPPKCESDGAKAKEAMTKPAVMPLPVVRVIDLPQLGKWCIVQKLDVERVDQGKYDSEYREQSFSRLSSERGQYLLAQWFKPEAVQKRANFERLGRGAVPQSREGIKDQQQHDPNLDF